MKKSFIIVFASLIILIALFMFLRPSDTPKLPISDNGSEEPPVDLSDVTDVKSFSDVNKRTASNQTGSTVRPERTPKPLPYPRISINYSLQEVSSIGTNKVDENNTLVLVKLDIRNYGYRYFDAYPNNFRGIVRGQEIIPLINVSTGDIIDAVIPNGSVAKGDLVFMTSKKRSMTKIIYSPINKSDSYKIIYTELSPSEMMDKKEEVIDDEDI